MITLYNPQANPQDIQVRVKIWEANQNNVDAAEQPGQEIQEKGIEETQCFAIVKVYPQVVDIVLWRRLPLKAHPPMNTVALATWTEPYTQRVF